MVAVPVFNQQTVSENPTATPYKSANASEAAFNQNMGLDDVSRGMIYDSKAIQEIRDTHNKTLVMEKSTQFDEAVLKTLYDKENGLYAKKGKAYLDTIDPTIQALGKTKESLLDGLDTDQQQLAMAVLDSKMANINESVMKNAVEQNEVYKTQTLNDLINTQTQLAMANRNSAGSVKTSIANINASIDATYGNSVDSEAMKNMKQKATSDLLVNVLEGRIADKNLYAKDFFEMFKSQIDPTKHAQLTESINNVDSDVRSRLLADGYITSGLTEEDAYKQAHSIKDLNLRDATERQLNQRYGKQRELKNQAEDDYAKKTWEVLLKNPDMNLIPSDMPADKKMSMIEFCKKGGVNGVTTDLNTWGALSRLSVDNPNEFKQLDLSQFSGSISQNDLKILSKKQQTVGTPEYSVVVANNQYVTNAAKALGFKKGSKGYANKEELATDAQTIINNIERTKGRQLKDYEKANIINSMGYKVKGGGITPKAMSTFDNVHKGTDLTTEEGYLKSVSDAIVDFESKNKRQPNSKELYDITWHYANLSKVQQQQKTHSVIDNVYNTKAMPHATKEVTYFSQTYLPSLGKKIGTQINVAPDQVFNPKSKDYKSWHNVNGVSHAVDVSMSGRPNFTKFDIVNNILKDFPNAKLGTSDAVILRKFAGNPNVIDERKFDTKHGTNHVNHLHVTLNTGNDTGGVVVANKPSTKQKPNNLVVDSGQRIMIDANGNRALVAVDSGGKPTKVIREL